MPNVVELEYPNSVVVEGEAGAVVEVDSTGQTVEIESECGEAVIEVGSPTIVEVEHVGGQAIVIIESTQTVVVIIEGVGAQGPPGPTA
jgi:hypothetical protein